MVWCAAQCSVVQGGVGWHGVCMCVFVLLMCVIMQYIVHELEAQNGSGIFKHLHVSTLWNGAL